MTHDIVVVGGGTGGTVLANRLADRLEPELASGEARVTLLTDDPDHIYKPTFLYVPFGEKTVEDARRPLAELVDDRIEIRIDRVTDIDTDGQTLETEAGDWVGYDQLVLAMGAQLVPEEVPGLKEDGHHFYGPEGATALRDELATFEEGHLVLSVVGVPHMCPAAPVEFVLMVDDWLRQRGRREDVELTYTYPIMRAHGIETIADWATELFDARDITLETFVNVESLDPEAGVAETMEGDEIDYDLFVAIPPHAGSDLIKDTGLGEDGWVAVDRHTLEAEHAENVYAIGDIADVPTSKAGSVAHYEAGTVAKRITSRVRGETPTAVYDGKTVCFLEAGLDEATFVEFGYGDEPTVRQPSQALHWSKLAYNEAYWLTARGLI